MHIDSIELTRSDAPTAVSEVREAERQLLARLFFGPPSGELRFKFFLTGCLFPAGCIATVLIAREAPALRSPWQSGEPFDYIVVLTSRTCQLVFLPLVSYSILSLGAWTIWPRLAAVCQRSRWFADMTYLALLPLELIADLLRRAMRISQERVARMYQGRD